MEFSDCGKLEFAPVRADSGTKKETQGVTGDCTFYRHGIKFPGNLQERKRMFVCCVKHDGELLLISILSTAPGACAYGQHVLCVSGLKRH